MSQYQGLLPITFASALAAFFLIVGYMQLWRLMIVEKVDGAYTTNAGIVYINAFFVGAGIGLLVLVIKIW